MADGPQIGRVVVDVDINSAEVRGEIRAALADRFQISVDVTKRSLTESRAKIRETISAKPYRISVDVSQANLARVRGEIRAALAAPFAINVVAATRGAATAKAAATKVAKSITDAERREEAVRKTIAARGEQDRVRIAERGRQQRATIRMRERAADIEAERAHQRSLIRDRLLADQRIALHDRRALDSRLAAQQRHQDQLSRSQERFRQKQLLAQQRLNNQLIAQAARTQAKIAAINRRPIGLQALQGIQALSAGLAQFDAMAVRILASSLRAFTAWSTAVSAVFAGVSVVAVKKFSEVELAGRRAGAVFASKELLDGLRQGKKAFGDYADSALRSSKAVIEASNQVAVTTIFNPREVAESARALAQAGLSEAEALQVLGVNARFAQSTQIDLLESTKLLTSGVHAAGLEMSQMSDLADKLAVASFEAQSDVDQIGEAFARVAGQFTGLNQSVDETIAAITLMARTGVEGRGAADQLNQGIRFVTKAAAEAPEAWQRFGLSVDDAQGRVRPFLDIMADIREVFIAVRERTGSSALAFKVLSDELRLPVRSMRPLFQMIQQLGDDESIDEVRKNVENASGAIAAMSRVIEGSLAVALQNTAEIFQVAFQKAGEAASKGIHGVLDAIRKLSPAMNEEARRAGEALGGVLRDFGRFLASPEFAEGASILREAVDVTLRGFRDMFREFGLAAGDGKSAFVGFSEAVLAFSRASARVLPAVARILGRLVRFLRENDEAVEFFAKASLGLVVARRMIGLVITPASAAATSIIKMRDAMKLLSVAATSGGGLSVLSRVASTMLLIDRRSSRASRNMRGILSGTAARGAARAGAASVASPATAARLKETSVAAASAAAGVGLLAAQAPRLGVLQRAVGLLAGVFGRLLPFLRLTLIASVRLSVYTAAAAALLVYLKGVFDGLRESLKLSGDESKKFKESLRVLMRFFELMAKPIEIAGELIYDFGKIVGKALGWTVVASVNALADAILRVSEGARDAYEWTKKILGLSDGGGGGGAFSAGGGPFFDRVSERMDKVMEVHRKALRKSSLTPDKEKKKTKRRPKKVSIELPSDLGDIGTGGAVKLLEFRDRTEETRVIVAGMSIAERRRAIAEIIRKIDRAGAASYKATRLEMVLLERAMPSIERAIESQRERVEELSKSLDELRNAQLRGTKAFSDAAFRYDQSIKRLQLRRIDLIRAGTSEEDERIKKIDEEIEQIELKAERSRLIESLRLDPLRRKLEETFNPVKEVTFQEAISGFQDLSKRLERESEVLRRQELTLESLNGVIQRASERFEDMDTVTRAHIESINKARQAAADAKGSYSGLSRSVAKAGGATGSTANKTKTLASRQGDAAKKSGVLAGALDEVFRRAGAAHEGLRNLAGAGIKVLVDSFIASASSNSRNYKLIAGSGAKSMEAFSSGVSTGLRSRAVPSIRFAHRVVSVEFSRIGEVGSLALVSARRSGVLVMNSFWAGMRARFGDASKKAGTIAHWLGVQIPDMIRELKGPVSYDAQILVPAGEAVMHGFEQGLRRGFEPVRGFLRDVGPSMEEHVPTDLFIKRSANFMVDVARGEMPDPYEVFADLVPTPLGEFAGILDPTLAFLHKTRSLADTEEMAAHLAKLFNLVVTDTIRPPGTLTSSGRVSDHSEGTAADFGGAVSNMDRLAAAIKPLFGQIFKQIIWRNKDVNRGFFVPDHMDHVHAAWLKAADFSLHSGKKGPTASLPGVPALIAQALSSASQRTGVSLQLLAAIARAESSFNPRAVSPAGAQGLMQLMPGTAAGLGVTNPFDPFQNALGGAKYIKQQLDRFGSIELALAAYNAGPGNALRALTSFRETIAYVRRVKDFLRIFAGFREHGGPTIAGRAYIVGEAGPEIHIPRTSGTVIDAETTRALLSGRSRGDITYSPTYNLKTATRDPRATAEMIDSHTMGRLRTVVL